MSGGSDDSPSYVQPPAFITPAEVEEYIDKTTGVNFKKGLSASGKETFLKDFKRLPQEQLDYDAASALMRTTSEKLINLNAYDPQATIDYLPFTNTINVVNQERTAQMQQLLGGMTDFPAYEAKMKDIYRQNIEQEFTKLGHETEASLNQSGYHNSSAARQLKALNAESKAKLMSEAEIAASQETDRKRIAEAQGLTNVYNVAESGRMGRLQAAEGEYRTQVQAKGILDQQRQEALQNQYGLFGLGGTVKNTDDSKRMGSNAADVFFSAQGRNDNLAMGRNNYNLADTNARNNFNAQTYAARGPSMEDQLFKLGTTVAGTAAGIGLAKKMF
jgi:hypothetical protein